MGRGVSKIRVLAAVLAAALTSAPSAAEEWRQGGQSAVRLIEGPADASGAPVAALEFHIRPGWKTYWRAPGEAGIPPTFDFSASENVARVEAVWPRPHVFDSFGYQTIGYYDELVVPLKITAVDPARPVRLKGALFWGVCSDICVPEQAEVDLSLDGVETPGAGALITAATAAAPERLGPETAACRVAGAGDHRAFTARLKLQPPPGAPPVVVVEGPQDAWFGPVSAEVKDGELHVAAPVEVYADNLWIDRSSLTLTVLSGATAFEISGCGASLG